MSQWMEAAAKVEADMVSLKQEVAELNNENDSLRTQIGSKDNIIDSMRRSQKLDGLRIVELEEKNRVLERDNAVLHSRGDQIVQIIKADGDRIAASSDLHPDQITNPRKAHDDRVPDMSEAYKRLEEQISNLKPDEPRLPHPALGDPYKATVDEATATAERLEQQEQR